MPRVLVTSPVHPDALALLRGAGLELDVNAEPRLLSAGEIDARLAGCAGAMTQVSDPVSGEVLSRHPQLRIVANVAVGYNNIDITAARRLGIVVTNTPGVLEETTADLAWALLLGAARRVSEADAWLRAGNWRGWSPSLLLGCDVHRKTLGIIGPGRIGAAVARRATGWEMMILYASPAPKPGFEARFGARHATLDGLLGESDFVTIHCPLNDATRGLLGAREFALMKPSAILVNTARGPIVVERELVEALRTGRIAAAGLDVFEDEPRVPAELIALPNTVLLPHLGSATQETRRRMAMLAAENVVAFFEGQGAKTAVGS